MPQEENLQFFRVPDDLSERRDLILCRLISLIFSVGARFKRLLINRVPIEEQVLDWTVIMRENGAELLHLPSRQAIIREPIPHHRLEKESLLQSLDGALDIHRQLQHAPRRLVQPVLVKLQHIHFLISRSVLPVVSLAQARVFFDLKHRAQRLNVGKELSCRLVRFHIDFFRFYRVVFLIIPDLQRHLLFS